MEYSEADLILNTDGSVYHLGLLPGQLAKTILTVGDPDRVSQVAAQFDHLEFKTQKREIRSCTGTYKGQRLSVISTGMGTDNIDIVFNEIDALFNIDLQARTPKAEHTQLQFIRLGTSGAIQADIPLGSLLLATAAVGVDSLGAFYPLSTHKLLWEMAVQEYFKKYFPTVVPYTVAAAPSLLNVFKSESFDKGITVTHPGFYGPQGRQARIPIAYPHWIALLQAFQAEGVRLTNFDMETAGIYALASMMGHQALSVNAILANRVTGDFVADPNQVVDEMIHRVLDVCTGL
ncbi:MAG: nucleoside phosphorylase [Flavobacteriaceae bacterium]